MMIKRVPTMVPFVQPLSMLKYSPIRVYHQSYRLSRGKTRESVASALVTKLGEQMFSCAEPK